MHKNNLGKCPNGNVIRWTNLAYQCYKLGGMCYKCDIPEDIKQKCNMKVAVIELVKKFGVPTYEQIQQ